MLWNEGLLDSGDLQLLHSALIMQYSFEDSRCNSLAQCPSLSSNSSMSLHAWQMADSAWGTDELRTLCFTHPSNLCEVLADTIITVRPLGSDIAEVFFVFEYICKEQCSIDVLSVSFSTALSNHYNLPTRLFHLIWNDDDDGIIVNYIVQPVTEEDGERRWALDTYDSSNPQCKVCTLPCRDADDDGSRELNCFRCVPCFLCPNCKVVLPSGNGELFCCYLCIRADEIHHVPDQYRFQILCSLRDVEPQVGLKS